MLILFYNTDGIRTSKAVDGVKHNYTLDGSRILSEDWTVGNVQHMLLFIYDASGSPVGFRYRNSQNFGLSDFRTYIYGKNAEGDILYIFNSSGTKVAEYTYDAWGNVTVTYNSQSSNPGVQYNPFRYRGYYYDEETGWYYLQSRYYNPAWGRFISPDSSLNANGDLLGFNLYAYCSNNPVRLEDPSGKQVMRKLYEESSLLIFSILSLSALSLLASSQNDNVFFSKYEPELTTCPNTFDIIKKDNSTSRSYSVYFLEDENGIIQYVGRVTDEGFGSRMSFHYNTRGLKPKFRITGLTKDEARGLEEMGMVGCHTINRLTGYNNKIHGISNINPFRDNYFSAGNRLLDNVFEETILNLFDR